MFKESSTAIRLAGNSIIILLLTICLTYGTSLFYQGDRSDFLQINAPPEFLDSL